MSMVLTGGAGFIGSCLLRVLNNSGRTDILVVDNIKNRAKRNHLSGKIFREYIHKDRFLAELPTRKGISHILHMGACSDTREKDWDYLYANNVLYSQALWRYCTAHKIPFFYASSAAVYGNGAAGFSEQNDPALLQPLNPYARSKLVFDRWVAAQTVCPPQWVGLRFFNVYGPNESAKGAMASMIYHGFCQAQREGRIQLFRSGRQSPADGEQARDFVYVKDICRVVQFFLSRPEHSGLYNVGTGSARSFRTLAETVFQALGRAPCIAYIDFPASLRGAYQYHTQADLHRLRAAGYREPFWSLEDGVRDYIAQYLLQNNRIY